MDRSVSQQNREHRNNPQQDQTLYVTIPPDGGFAWVIVFCSFLTNFIVDGILYSFGKLLPFFISDVHLSEPQIAIVHSLQNATYYFVGPLCSAFVNRFGFRTVAIAGVLISGISTFISSYVHSFTLLAIFYGILGGTGYGMIYAPSIIIIGFYFEKYRAIATGLAVCGSGFGTLIIAAMHTILLEKYGLRLTIQFQALAVFCCALFSISYFKLDPVLITVIEEEKSEALTEISSQVSSEINFDQFSRIFAPQKMPNIFDTIKKPSALSIASQKSTQLPPSILKPSMRRLSVVTEKKTKSKSCKRCIRNCCKCQCKKEKKRVTIYQHRPLYKDDIFFAGNLNAVDEYKKVQSEELIVTNEDSEELPTRKRNSVIYNLSITRAPPPVPKNRRNVVSVAITNALGLLFDASLLKSYTFIIISIAGFISALGQYSTYVFITNRADLNGMPRDESLWLIPMIGLSNLFGRIAAGFLSFLPSIDPSKATGFAYIISGVSTMASGIRQYDSAKWQYLYCAVYGFTVAFYSSLKSVIYVQNLGLERLTNAFGFSSLIMGFGVLLGTPISGFLFKITGNYMAGFLVCGMFLIVSGICFMLIKKVKNWETNLIAKSASKGVTFYT